MEKINRFNAFYAKYLYIPVPACTVLISLFELLFEKNALLRLTAYGVLAFLAAFYFVVYVNSGKKEAMLPLAELMYCYFAWILFLGDRFHISNLAWMILTFTVVLAMVFVLLVNRWYKKHTNP